MTEFHREVREGKRFQFGKNWLSFLQSVNDEKIAFARDSMKGMLKDIDLTFKTFLDVGSGSGLSSLVARSMGAKVTSFDYDPDSVSSTTILKEKYFPHDNNWIIEQGSILDTNLIIRLGKFDVVYSWGVLHHTGKMWQGLKNIIPLVKEGGYLFIALYNDQSYKSKFWWKVKKLYCSSLAGKCLVTSIFFPLFFFVAVITSIKNRNNVFVAYKKNRGMSISHDWKDWLGGFPFEVAKIEDVFNFFKSEGFSLFNIKTTTSMGCNEFVFFKNNSRE